MPEAVVSTGPTSSPAPSGAHPPLSPTRPASDPEHDARVARSVARAFAETPYYASKARRPPEAQRGEPIDRALRALPLLTKADVRATLPKAWVPAGRDLKAELASGDLELVETSGSTDDRLRILWDKGWWLRQEERAMRVNGDVTRALDGALGPYREAILTTPVCGLGSCHAGDPSFDERLDEHRLFLNTRQDPTFWTPDVMTRMLDELERHGTIGLESDPTYLAALAAHATALGRTIHAKGFVQLTYALATEQHRRAIRRAYAGPVLQLYGASEVGVLFMEGEDGLLHHAPFTTHVELLPAKVPTPGAEDVALVVVTTLDRVAQPLVRFVLGDVVRVAKDAPRRFTSVAPLKSVEGRVQDLVVRPDGALVTAAAIDRALATIDGVRAFQVNQRAPERIDVDVVPTDGAGANGVDARVLEALAPLVGTLDVAVRKSTAIAAEASGKFRVSRRHFPLDLARAFEGVGS